MKIRITEPYLWLPVDRKKPQVKLHFYCGKDKFQEVDIRLGDASADFYTSMDVSRFQGQEIAIEGSAEELFGILCSSEEPRNAYPFRPLIHFAPRIGWMNDPNGLVYADGVYHLFYQWNPYDVIWGNMHWGHAVSRDLITWEHRPTAMEPDVYGTVYSGCGWQDKENAAGFGKDALLFFYTAAGGSNEWSAEAGNRHTQRLAVSTDGGNTLVKEGKPVVEHIRGENRDPKVFYHEASGAYIMVLYLEENEFAIFRSADLLHWKETQRFSAEGMWECPDLIELPVTTDNRENPDDENHACSQENPVGRAACPDEKKWVFWSADGYYMTGDFDGYHFTPDSGVKAAYLTKLPYAAQTYAGCGDRVISVSWLRTQSDQGNTRGIMALPAELSLVRTEDDMVICFEPVKELQKHRIPVDIRALEPADNGAWQQTAEPADDGARQGFRLPLEDQAAEIIIEWKAQEKGYTKLAVGDVVITVDFAEGRMEITGQQSPKEPVSIPLDGKRVLDRESVADREKAFDLRVIVDNGVVEFYGKGGMLYGAVTPQEGILQGAVTVENDADITGFRAYRIR